MPEDEESDHEAHFLLSKDDEAAMGVALVALVARAGGSVLITVGEWETVAHGTGGIISVEMVDEGVRITLKPKEAMLH